LNSEFYINQWLSLLQFNLRVLEQAVDENLPLIERLRFLLIFSSNLDEFFEIRVAGLMRQIRAGTAKLGPDGMHPQDVLTEISRLAHEAVEKQYKILNDVLLPALEKENIRFLARDKWTDKQQAWLKKYYRDSVAPVITPIALDMAHPFPRLVNKSLNFIVSLDGKDAFGRQLSLAIIPAPKSLPRLIRLPDEICEEGINFVFLSSIIHDQAGNLFPGMSVTGCYQFRVTRNADLDLDEDIEDLTTAVKGELLSRRYGDEVRLEVADNCPKHMIDFLLRKFSLKESQLYLVNGPVNLARLSPVLDINVPKMKFTPFTPKVPAPLQMPEDVFEVVAQQDILLMHPFESFGCVVNVLREAARDPNVLAIKQTLYRTGDKSEIIDALVEAARNGKEVTAVVELLARFDEASNIEGATRLQEAGAIVVYGVVGYKTHAKMMLIVRREGGKIRRYAHLGTGNYHAGNARIYTDYSLITAN
ncbi:MAG TPA: polyphosphate kinase 1, partial [Pseudomonadales bacterium]|nr:polyphosphate kinase 1 [Pseudomonadales bacterium]